MELYRKLLNAIFHISYIIFLILIVLSFPAWGQSPEVAPLTETKINESETEVSPDEPKPELERPTI